MKFPKGKLILKDTPVQYVNFDNILNQAKKARDGHLTGYIEIKYPNDIEYLFLRDGQVMNAATSQGLKYNEKPIKEIIQKAKRARRGSVNIHNVDIELLDMILCMLKEKPMFSGKKIEEINPEELLEKLVDLDFTGFLILNKDDNTVFVKFDRGKPEIIYPLNKSKKKINSVALLNLLNKEKDMFITAYKGEKKKKQANPALIELYLKFINSLIDSFVEIVGPSLVRRTLIPSFKNASRSEKVLNNFEIDEDLNVKSTHFVATTEEITRGFALWIDQFSDAIFVVLGRKTDDIILQSIRDYRFALKKADFFEHSKLSRLQV